MALLSDADAPPEVFKGIALLTPGGDLVYCIDPDKRSHWHLDLCTTLQDYLSLSEPPFFLLPCYTATVDRWIDPSSQQRITLAEAYPRVMPFQALLNTVFHLRGMVWQPIYSAGETCAPSRLEVHRDRFPQLWQPHELVVRAVGSAAAPPPAPQPAPSPDPAAAESYVYRLFVNSDATAQTERILELLQTTLDQVLAQSYTLQVVDVGKHPEEAEAALIAVTPTLMRVWPLPLQRLSGGLTNRDRLLQFLQQERGQGWHPLP